MDTTYDVIVVGAGNGGLAAAATTAKGGLKTLLLEKHNLPGGCASSFVRGRFEFEPSLHEKNERRNAFLSARHYRSDVRSFRRGRFCLRRRYSQRQK